MRTKIASALCAVLLSCSLQASGDEIITGLTLENCTGNGEYIEVWDSDGSKLFGGYVGNHESFSFTGDGYRGALGEDIWIFIDGDYHTNMDTEGEGHVHTGDDVDSFTVKDRVTIDSDYGSGDHHDGDGEHHEGDGGDHDYGSGDHHDGDGEHHEGDGGDHDYVYTYDQGWDAGYDPGFYEGKSDACNNRSYYMDVSFDNDGQYDDGWRAGYTKGYNDGWNSCDRPDPKPVDPCDNGSYIGGHHGGMGMIGRGGKGRGMHHGGYSNDCGTTRGKHHKGKGKRGRR